MLSQNSNLGSAIAFKRACVKRMDEIRSVAFIGELADDFFNQVFDSREPDDTAVFVHGEYHRVLALLNFFEERVDVFRFRHKVQVGADKRFNCRRLAIRIDDIEEVDNPDEVMALFFVNGNAREAGIGGGLQKILVGCVFLNRDDIHEWHHHLGNRAVLQVQQTVNHSPLMG